MIAEQLLHRARAGDESAFAELTDPFRPELHVHCYRIVASVQDAEDLVQETLLAAWPASKGSRDGHRCAPGCTGSPPTDA